MYRYNTYFSLVTIVLSLCTEVYVVKFVYCSSCTEVCVLKFMLFVYTCDLISLLPLAHKAIHSPTY